MPRKLLWQPAHATACEEPPRGHPPLVVRLHDLRAATRPAMHASSKQKVSACRADLLPPRQQQARLTPRRTEVVRSNVLNSIATASVDAAQFKVGAGVERHAGGDSGTTSRAPRGRDGAQRRDEVRARRHAAHDKVPTACARDSSKLATWQAQPAISRQPAQGE